MYARSHNVSKDMKSISLYQFFDDHTVYYFSHSYYPESFSDERASVRLFTWETDGIKIIIKSHDQITNELYYIDESCLSVISPDKFLSPYACYFKSQKTPEPIQEKELLKPASPNQNIFGKWAFMYAPENDSPSFDFSAFSMDLYIYEDGSAYIILGTAPKGKSALSFSYSDGLWIGDSSAFRIKTKDSVFNGWLTEDGILELQFTDDFICSFSRVTPKTSF